MLLSYSSYSKHVAQNERRTRVGGNQRSNTKFTRPNGQYAHMPHISRSIFTLREESGYVEIRQFMLLNTLFKVSLSFLQTLKYFASIQLSKVIYLSWQQFLTCDALRERGLCSCPVSVCPSVRQVGGLYPHSWRYRQTFSRPCSPSLQFFCLHAPKPNSSISVRPDDGRSENTRVWKLVIFDWNRRLSRKWYEVGPWLLRNVNRKS